MNLPERMTFGIFLGPFHRVGENPTLAIDRDLELIQWLDYLGYDEAWIGEHHSAGWEIISSPEVFIAAAAERTRHIKLGTGVISLPYHHPFMVANRMVQLDHMTHGRVMMGVGPGALPGDAYMMGIEHTTQRERMDEALASTETVLNHYLAEDNDVRVQVIANGPGLRLLTSDSPYSERISQLDNRYANVQFVACQNTIDRLRKKTRRDVHLLPEVLRVDSGVADITRKRRNGWLYIGA